MKIQKYIKLKQKKSFILTDENKRIFGTIELGIDPELSDFRRFFEYELTGRYGKIKLEKGVSKIKHLDLYAGNLDRAGKKVKIGTIIDGKVVLKYKSQPLIYDPNL